MPPFGWATSHAHLARSIRQHRFQQCAPAESFDVTPGYPDLPDQLVETCAAGELTLFGEVGVANGGKNGQVTENLLYFEQIDARFN